MRISRYEYLIWCWTIHLQLPGRLRYFIFIQILHVSSNCRGKIIIMSFTCERSTVIAIISLIYTVHVLNFHSIVSDAWLLLTKPYQPIHPQHGLCTSKLYTILLIFTNKFQLQKVQILICVFLLKERLESDDNTQIHANTCMHVRAYTHTCIYVHVCCWYIHTLNPCLCNNRYQSEMQRNWKIA